MSLGVGKVFGSLVGPAPIIGPGVPSVLVEGMPCSVLGDKGTPHGEPPHSNPIIMRGNPTVLVGGRPIVREMASVASCGHPVMKGPITVRTL